MKASEETKLLGKIASGLLDGIVGNILETGRSTTWMEIKNGKAIQYKLGPSKRIFNGKENERIPGKLRILREWNTDDDLLAFLQKYGYLLHDFDVRQYSKKYKP